ncbi:NUDIX domain-containing protein [Gephyromycinifex aptenodytis]|uniref:NUDIX domain-containing protein n=1 Tax=Gephyromycinifex aptenodytis TaxID=2716227 RepID=UPI00144887F1|nr:NUDIX domain-containing protein [Gephyromycinifex aptenodytis]
MRIPLVPSAYIFLRRGDQVLLQLRRNTGYMDGHWAAGAAGHVEAGESVTAAALREAEEELGVRIAPEDLQPLTSVHRTDGTDSPIEQRVDWFFCAQRWQGQPRALEPEKCADLQWFSLSELPTPIPAYELAVLRHWAQGSLPALLTHGFQA